MTERRRKGILAGLFELLGDDEAPNDEAADNDAPVAPPPAPDPGPAQGDGPTVHEPVPALPQTPVALEPEPPSRVVVPPAQTLAVAEPTLPPSIVARLSAPSADERLGALHELAGRPFGTEVAAAVVDRLRHDPEATVRSTALEVLSAHDVARFTDDLRAMLQDPCDEVRAGAARLIARLGPDAVPDLVRLVGLSRWPETQRVALDALPDLVRSLGAPVVLLERVGTLDEPVLGRLRSSLAALARSCDPDALVAALSFGGAPRLGAARLLLEEGSIRALQAVAVLETDEAPEVRAVAARARSLVRSSEPTAGAQSVPAPELPPVAPSLRSGEALRSGAADVAPPMFTPVQPPPVTGDVVRAEMISGLAKVMADPDEAVRARAADALMQADSADVARWVRSKLREGDAASAESAAAIAGTMRLADVAPTILERAAGLPAELRASLVGALADIGLAPDALASLVRSVDASRRHEAVRVVGEVGGRSVVGHLKPFLGESSGPVRMAALEIVGRWPDPETLEMAQNILRSDSSPSVRATAVKVLARIDDPDLRTRALVHALDDADPDVRLTAVETLIVGDSTGPAAALLLRAVDDADERVRMAALRGFTHLRGDPRAVWSALMRSPDPQREHLVSMIEDRGAEELAALAFSHLGSLDADERSLAVSLAGRAATPQSISATISALSDPIPDVRRVAAHALSQVRTPEAIPALVRTLKDPHVAVRVEAVRALGVIDDDEVIPVLIDTLRDPEARVRDEAADVLRRWRSPVVARRIVEAFRTGDLGRNAADLLTQMGEAAVEPLLDLVRSDEPDLTQLAGELLSTIAGPERFVRDLGALDPALRTRAAEALGGMGGPVAVEGLIRALSDPDAEIRRTALNHLGRLGSPRAYDAVRHTFTHDPVLEVVEAAELALRSLQPGE